MQECAKSLLKKVAFGLLVTMTVPAVMSMEDEDLEKSKNLSLKTTQDVEMFSQNESENSGVIDEKVEKLAHLKALEILEQNREQINQAKKASRFILKNKPVKLGGYYQK